MTSKSEAEKKASALNTLNHIVYFMTQAQYDSEKEDIEFMRNLLSAPKAHSEMPEEIWAYRDDYFDNRWNRTNVVESTRYIRADLAEKMEDRQ